VFERQDVGIYDSYVVLYDVDPGAAEVTVVRVRHGKRRPLKRR